MGTTIIRRLLLLPYNNHLGAVLAIIMPAVMGVTVRGKWELADGRLILMPLDPEGSLPMVLLPMLEDMEEPVPIIMPMPPPPVATLPTKIPTEPPRPQLPPLPPPTTPIKNRQNPNPPALEMFSSHLHSFHSSHSWELPSITNGIMITCKCN